MASHGQERTRSHPVDSGPAADSDRASPGRLSWFQPATAVSAVPGKQTLSERAAPAGAAAAVQKQERGSASTADAVATASRGVAGGGSALPHQDRIQRLFGRHDISGVQAHDDGAAQQASAELGARAYAIGDHVAFDGAPDLHTAAHEAAHTVQQRAGVQLRGGVGEAGDAYERHADAVADRVVAGQSAEGLLDEMAPGPRAGAGAVQRREINPDAEYDKDTSAAASMTPADWLTSDRVGNTSRWQAANQTNLLNADSSQYRQIVERRDFYLWFYNTTCAMGCTTRWALAAYVVANGAHQVADMDDQAIGSLGNSITNVASIELQGAMRDGNQAIFNNVLPKLRDLYRNALKGPVIGKAALSWDMQTLAEEQALIQPMYNTLSPQAKDQLSTIAHKWGGAVFAGSILTGGDQVPGGPNINPGKVPGMPDTADITDPAARWRYGMSLGAQFTPGGTLYDGSQAMPAVGPDYQPNAAGTNKAFDSVNDRPNLHVLDAYLNSRRMAERTGPNPDERRSAKTYLGNIIAKLSPTEKQLVLTDRMPDGKRYSTAMGDLGVLVLSALPYIADKAVDDEQVQAALPAGADSALVSAFFDRFHAAQGAHTITITPPVFAG